MPRRHPAHPIGNLTSQFLANLHLDRLDHRLKGLPGVRVSMRYVDDLALFADRPEPLLQALNVLQSELSALRLRLHPSKTRLLPTARGASFVGYRVIGDRIRLRNHSLLRIRRGLRVWRARRSALSWNAHLAHGPPPDLAERLRQTHSRLPNPDPISALQAACLLFVGVQLLLPGQESGFDFQREFELARGLVGE